MNKEINAIGIVRQMVADGQISQEVAEKYFPELKESEDESISRKLIAFLKQSKAVYGDGFKQFGLDIDDALAWLERQGEKPNNVYDKELSEILGRVIRRYINDPNIPYTEREKVSMEIIPYVERLEKQSEQKSIEWVGELEEKLSNATPEQLAEWKEKYFKEEPAEWSEVDEEMFKTIANSLDRGLIERVWHTTIEKVIDWLKSLKDRVQPQPKQKWSEEDREMRMKVLKYLSTRCNVFEYEEVENWLKSLSPQSQWRPSDEQMKLLREVQQALLGKDCHNRFVDFMYELKRLREE